MRLSRVRNWGVRSCKGMVTQGNGPPETRAGPASGEGVAVSSCADNSRFAGQRQSVTRPGAIGSAGRIGFAGVKSPAQLPNTNRQIITDTMTLTKSAVSPAITA